MLLVDTGLREQTAIALLVLSAITAHMDLARRARPGGVARWRVLYLQPRAPV